MQITWHGQNCFSFEGKSAVVVVDPSAGRLPRANVDVLVLPRPINEDDVKGLKTTPFVVETPGEFEAKGVFVRGMADGGSGCLMFRFEIDGIHIGHLSSLAKKDQAVETFFDGVDVLCVPTGGDTVLSPTDAAEVVSSIEPRIVIPMHFKTAAEKNLQPVEKFCQAMGMAVVEPQAKLSLQAKDLPHEDTSLVILSA